VAASTEPVVVAGLDGSPSGDAALDWAVTEARLRAVPLRIVHASTGDAGSEEQGRELLRRAAERAAEAPGVQAVLSTDAPVPALLAASRGAVLVALGVRGVHGIRHARLGTVATTLTRRAHCPVVVTREPENTSSGDRVVVGVDAATGSPQALDFALDEAARRGLALTVLAVDVGDGEPGRGPEAVRSALAACARYPAVRVTSLVEEALSVTRVLVEHGRQATLLVVGARPEADVAGTMSVSSAVLLHATCTVAVVRDR
jgi:nucleotide-binding universal stress UspA family protein